MPPDTARSLPIEILECSSAMPIAALQNLQYRHV
jgi:hypothetical protein